MKGINRIEESERINNRILEIIGDRVLSRIEIADKLSGEIAESTLSVKLRKLAATGAIGYKEEYQNREAGKYFGIRRMKVRVYYVIR